MIRLEGISYQYPNRKDEIFNDFHLRVPKGNVVVLTGENGCGKTTLLKILAGIIPRFSGGILKGSRLLNGQPYDSMDTGNSGMLFDGHDLQFIQFRVDQEILYILESQGISQVEIQNRFDRLVDNFDLKKFIDREIQTLSSGETQILKLALAFIHQSRIILMDEPLAHLDGEQKNRVLNVLLQMKNEGDHTYIVADHDPDAWNVFGSSVQRIHLSSKKEEKSILTDLTPMKMHSDKKNILQIKNIAFSYNDRSILSGFSRNISRGECIAITGSNGSGKTTLLNLIKGNLRPKEGEISFPRELRTRLFTNPASRNFFSLRVAEELKLDNKSADTSSFFRLDHFLNEYVFDLSLGEQQKVGITAIAQAPVDLILLDEPFLHLDTESREDLINGIQKIKKAGTTVVLTLHEPQTADTITDQIWNLGS